MLGSAVNGRDTGIGEVTFYFCFAKNKSMLNSYSKM